MSVRPKSIALLICDTPLPSVIVEHGDYHKIFSVLLKKSLPDHDFILDSYDVVHKMEYPDDEKLDEYDCVMLTGSAASAYEDKEWIHKLIDFVKRIADTKPNIKLVGICYGHQIISMAIGGTCVKNHGKWEVGPTAMTLTELGKDLLKMPGDELILQEMHQDYVPAIPPNCHLLAFTSISPNQGYVRFTSHQPPSSGQVDPSSIQILTVQGHPEFTQGIMDKLVVARTEKGILTKEMKEDADKRSVLRNDGVIVAKAIWRVLGVDV
ncbi:hypothetical protein D9758_005672 [Tetrapyrgos nigripes]|uniref:Glutamine amidotransferase domain-containing protein n=1 Tax=Tetrapyrgos nigripes TaxID=182062 RepID=A0A8H5GJM3_9AGAR|nr:hypothetical protein D9758_005672 [Tetrapyrgos nigripes]